LIGNATDTVSYYKLMKDSEFIERLSKDHPQIDVKIAEPFKDEIFQGYHWMGALTALVSKKSVTFVSINGRPVDRCPTVLSLL
jgi:hypothetical protein